MHLRVLVVEGESDVAQGWAQMLRPRGHATRALATFPQAREVLLQRVSFDVVAVDRLLPGGDDGTRLLPVIEALQPAPAVVLLDDDLREWTCVDVRGRPVLALPRTLPFDQAALSSRVRLVEQLAAPDRRKAAVHSFALRHGLSEAEENVVRYLVDGLTPLRFSEHSHVGAEGLLALWTRILHKSRHTTRVELFDELVQRLGDSPQAFWDTEASWDSGVPIDVEVSIPTPHAGIPVTVPRYRPKPAAEMKEEEIRRVLVVDDEPLYQQMLRIAFSQEGLFVRCCGDADAALRALKREEFDVALVDESMPGMDGVGLVRALRGKGHRIPVLLLTGDTAPQSGGALGPLGIHGFVPKPWGTAAELVARVRRVLRQRDDGD